MKKSSNQRDHRFQRREEMVNGCCKRCMKAFSKMNKVNFFLLKFLLFNEKLFSSASVKFQRGFVKNLFHLMDVIFVVAMVVIQKIKAATVTTIVIIIPRIVDALIPPVILLNVVPMILCKPIFFFENLFFLIPVTKI